MEEKIDVEVDYDEIWKSIKMNDDSTCKTTAKVSQLKEELQSATASQRKINLSSKLEEFEKLKKKSEEIRHFSKLRQLKTEKYKTYRHEKKLSKQALLNQTEDNKDKTKEEWKDIKPFLTINDHLQGPVSHGSCGPKTELECMVDDAIQNGDLEKAEILSDTLANRQFAVKIANAFDAKRYSEEKAEEEELLKAKKLKKIRWGFEAKERWEMKGNM